MFKFPFFLNHILQGYPTRAFGLHNMREIDIFGYSNGYCFLYLVYISFRMSTNNTQKTRYLKNRNYVYNFFFQFIKRNNFVLVACHELIP